jgi:hypothetical protein
VFTIADGAISLEAPAGWQRVQPKTGIVETEFSIPSEGKAADGLGETEAIEGGLAKAEQAQAQAAAGFGGLAAAGGATLVVSITLAVMGAGFAAAGKPADMEQVRANVRDALRPITDSQWYRKATIRERGLVHQGMMDEVARMRADGMSEMQALNRLARKYGRGSEAWKELARKTGTGSAAGEASTTEAQRAQSGEQPRAPAPQESPPAPQESLRTPQESLLTPQESILPKAPMSFSPELSGRVPLAQVGDAWPVAAAPGMPSSGPLKVRQASNREDVRAELEAEASAAAGFPLRRNRQVLV